MYHRLDASRSETITATLATEGPWAWRCFAGMAGRADDPAYQPRPGEPETALAAPGPGSEVVRPVLGEVVDEGLPPASLRVVVEMARVEEQAFQLGLVVRLEQVGLELDADGVPLERLVAPEADRSLRDHRLALRDRHRADEPARDSKPGGLIGNAATSPRVADSSLRMGSRDGRARS